MIITNDENIKSIYKFKNKRSGFPKAEIIIAFEFAILGVSSSTIKVNQSPKQFVNISKKNEISAKQALSIGKDDSGLFNANQLTIITNEVGKMSEVTQKDLNESEKYFDKKLDKLDGKVSDLLIDVEGMKKDIKNMPNQIKAEKYDNFKGKYEAPIITGVVVGVILIVVKIIFMYIHF